VRAIVMKSRSLIAVVDDEEPIRKALRRLLRSAGMDVDTFPSGVEFLESLSTRHPDCIVLDLHMPLVNGFEVQAQMARSGVTVPIVVITGHDSDETRQQALARFPVAYLRKPVNDQVLLDAIALALSHNVQQGEI
jgi:FixJ family two-component response regulator